jgi:hypothetical protein
MKLTSWNRVGIVTVAVFIGLLGLGLAGLANRDDGTDWNPLVRSESELQGGWTSGATALRLEIDGKFSCAGPSCVNVASGGRWSRSGDFYIALSATTGGSAVWRIAKRDGQLQLLSGKVEGDPDLWRVDAVYTKD